MDLKPQDVHHNIQKDKMRCILLGSSSIKNTDYIKAIILPNDFIICVDGGFILSKKLNINPNVFIGDNDSCKNKVNSMKSFIYNKEKDETDMMLAVKYALSLKFNEFIIFGGTAGRLDHTYANFCILEFLSEKNKNIKILDEDNEIFFTGNSLKIKKNNKKYISFFPFGCDSCIISANDLKYPLLKTTLKSNFPLGISNEMLTDETKINVENGKAIIFLSKDPTKV